MLVAMFLSLACEIGNLAQPQPAGTSTPAPSRMPFPPQASTRMPDTTFAPLEINVTPPAWVADFANPILLSIVNRHPDFEDDFAGLNQGWFYVFPGQEFHPFYAQIQDETLIMSLPEGSLRNELTVYNPRLIHKNFVLSFDFKFGKTEPGDTFRLEFDQTKDQSIDLDFIKSESGGLEWHLQTSSQSTGGRHSYFAPVFMHVVIILQNKECAVFFNHAPLGYLNDCRAGALVLSSPRAVTFHLLSPTGYAAVLTIDNVKLWDLGMQ